MEIKKFEKNLIAFDSDNNQINATDLLKAYNANLKGEEKEKRMGDYTRLKSTNEFIKLLVEKTGFPVISTRQGIQGGTWMSKLLAYDFAAWLSPEFKLFVYETFDEAIQNKLRQQQAQLDYFWDKSDQNDLYPKY